MKGDAGIIGISENESALKRWMVAGPVIGRILNEFDLMYTHNDKETDRHFEQAPSTQRIFAANVKSVMEVIEDYDNPFTDETPKSPCLIKLLNPFEQLMKWVQHSIRLLSRID